MTRVRDQQWWKDMQPRRDKVRQAGRDDDTAFLETLGSMEQYEWHEGRKEVDPEHRNPYASSDRASAVKEQEH